MKLLLLTLAITSVSFADFIADYADNRDRFLEDMKKIGVKPTKIKVHARHGVKDKLFTDFVHIKPKNGRKKEVVVITTGIHGAEGPVGSAVLHQFANECLPKIHNNPKYNGTGFILVHAINPWGYANGRRNRDYLRKDGSVESIDLNRNCFDASKPFPKNLDNKEYDQMKDILCLKKPATYMSPGVHFGYDMTTSGYLGVGSALRGQYKHPQCPYYGGRKLTPECKNIQSKIKPLINQYRGGRLHADIHSGLGSKGVNTLMVNNDRSLALAQRMIQGLGSGYTAENETSSFPVRGDITQSLLKIKGRSRLPGAIDMSTTFEMGTYQGMSVYGAVRTNTACQTNPKYKSSRSCKKAALREREVFAPINNKKWNRLASKSKDICTPVMRFLDEAITSRRHAARDARNARGRN